MEPVSQMLWLLELKNCKSYDKLFPRLKIQTI